MYDLSFFIIILTPFVSFGFSAFVSSLSFKYRYAAQKVLYISLLVVIAAWYVLEVYTPTSTDIRLDLFLVVPCIVAQFFIVFEAWVRIRDDEVLEDIRANQ